MTHGGAPPNARAIADEWFVRAQRPGLKKVMRAQVDGAHDEPATEHTRQILGRLLDAARDHLGRDLNQIVEAGCGIGRLTDVLAAHAGHVTAIDFTEGMLAEAQQRWRQLDNVEFRLSRLQDFPWAAGSWDVTVTVWVLMHVLDDAELTQLCQAIGQTSRLVIAGEYTTAATPVGNWSRLRSAQTYADLFGARIVARDTLNYAGDVTTFLLLDTGTR